MKKVDQPELIETHPTQGNPTAGTVIPARVVDSAVAAPEPQRMMTAPTAKPSILAMLDTAAASGNTAVIETMAKLYREERDDARRMAFDAAMSKAQSEMGRIERDGFNPQTHSKYSTYAALDRALRPIYTANGFGLSFNTAPGSAPEFVLVTCHVSHRDGWGQDYRIDMPADGKGAKGGDVMTKTHATGSATKYGMRYLLTMIFNVASGEDDDGNKAGGGNMMSAEHLANLKKLCEVTGTKEINVATVYGVSTLEAIPDVMYKAASQILEKKLPKEQA